MDETNETLGTEEKTNLIGKFSQLPGGVQRIILAVLLLLIVAAAFFMQRLVRAEEEPEPEAILFETAESFAAEVQQEA